MQTRNRLLSTDSYKQSHFLQYPEGTTRVFSYIESRGGLYDEILFFGLQAFIKDYLLKPITMEEVEEAKDICEAHGVPFNFEMWKYIVTELDGKLPLLIKAVPEGTLVSNKNVLVTVQNTDPNCFALTSFFETALLRAVWYPTQVATTSFRIKKIIKEALEATGTPEAIDFKLHDFGARGVSSGESAMLGGMGHLVNFMGTDTMEALVGARRFYGATMPAFSIPAAEHSTMTCLGQPGEINQMRRMVEKFAGEGKIYACVSDGYDIFNAVENIWGGELKDLVINSGGTLVVRPDSGDPVTIVLKVVELLGKTFGYTVNDKGFKVLHPSVRVIQGDGINECSVTNILDNLIGHGWSADNIAFGMGGALLQHHTRDDNRWAMKCSAIEIDGKWHNVFKDPVTDKGKTSKKGRIMLWKTHDRGWVTKGIDSVIFPGDEEALRMVFREGQIFGEENLDQIRARANLQ